MFVFRSFVTQKRICVAFLTSLLCTTTFVMSMQKQDSIQKDTPLPFVFLSESEGDYPDSFKLVQDEIVKKYPNAPCTNLVLGNGKPELALQNLDTIIEHIEKAWTNQVANKTTIPVLAIGSSQSALTLRLWIQKHLQDHPIKYKKKQLPAIFQAILVCGMQGGYYGIPEDKKPKNNLEATCTLLQSQSLKQIFDSLSMWQMFTLIGSSMSTLLSKGMVSAGSPILYKPEIQERSSFAGYWKDPVDLKTYKKSCAGLPRYNNEIEHADAELFQKNIKSVELWNFLGASEDPKILPPQSALFRFYKKGSNKKIEKSFEKTDQYKKNLLGFKDLYDQKRALFTEIETDQHGHQNPLMIPAIMNAIKQGQDRWQEYKNSQL